MKTIIFDTETLRWSDEVEGGWDNIKEFGLAVCCALGFIDDLDVQNHSNYCHFIYIPDDNITKFLHPLPDSKASLEKAFDHADRIVSFNAESFDFEVMESAGFDVSAWKGKSFDILARFKEVAGHRISLDNLAHAVLGKSKKMDGKKAVHLWKAAEFMSHWGKKKEGAGIIGSLGVASKYLFQAVIDYCLDDVHLTAQLYAKLLESRGELMYRTLNDGIRTVTLEME